MKIIARSVFGLMCLLMLFTTGCATIHESAANGDYAEVERFLQEGADVNARDKDGKTPLMCAAQLSNLEMVKYLVDKGGDVNAEDKWGETVLKWALTVYVDENAVFAFDAKSEDRTTVFKFLVDKGADVNATNKYGETLLMAAAASKFSNLKMVQFLVAKGGDVNAMADNGRTALSGAASSGHLEIAKFLVDKGADVNKKGMDGWTPLMSAALRLDLEMVKFLVDKGADVNAKAYLGGHENGWTALTYAEKFNGMALFDSRPDRKDKKAIIEFLKQHGAKE